MNSREKLKELLKELFRIESSDLDFGIYRIMNQKREEINDFIENDLDKYIDEALINIEGSNKKELEEKLEEIEEGLKELGVIDYTESDKYNRIKEELQKYNDKNPIDEIDVYEHIYNFFKRYYDNGDFISQMRYSKENKYVVPYNGEEVYLHWANKDQYYVKTSEDFIRYSFEKETIGVKVEFKVNNAELDKNNIKPDETRYFLLHEDFFQYEKENKLLNIYFEYRALTEEEKKKYKTQNIQNDINKYIFKEIKNKLEKDDIDNLYWLLNKSDNPNKSILEKHIYKYTKKNKSDYFIHKDLKGFLNRELDFYIKNEILDLDILNSNNVDDIRKYLIKIQALRDICERIIEFLDSIENFQKKLFTKKKFVLQSEYCLTLDKISEDIREDIFKEILSNNRQLEEWKNLYYEDVKDIEDLYYGEKNLIDNKELKKFVIDTQFFHKEFKNKLLSSFENLDEETDGLLIHSENYQGLNLLQEKYKGKVKSIYIDPPYNTKNDDFMYKDGYKSSSWLSCMSDRLKISKHLLNNQGTIWVSCDDYEVSNLRILMDLIYGKNNFLNRTLIWHIPDGTNKGHIARGHEYILPYALDANVLNPFFRNDIEDNISEERLTNAPGPKNPTSEIMFKKGLRFEGEDMVIKGIIGDKEPIEIIGEMCFQDGILKNDVVLKSSWRNKEQIEAYIRGEKVFDEKGQELLEVFFAKDGKPKYRKKLKYYTPKSVQKFADPNFGFEVNFSNHKPLELPEFIAKLNTINNDIILDFFAGSGTTAHSIIKLNKKDQGNRKYILIEMGDYFNTVLKPRIQKAVFSDHWEEGKPKNYKGHSHMFKYIRLEQYEDSLKNISFAQKEIELEGSQIKMEEYFDDYLIRYMLDYETEKSLLDIDKFKTPFDYKIKLENENKDIANVDLVETFNYLIGLSVEKVKIYNNLNRKYKTIIGKANEEKTIVIWRNVEDLDMEKDREFIESEIIQDNKFDKIYINCDNYVKGSLLIEEQFYNLMFEE